jgi:hypothetical protein
MISSACWPRRTCLAAGCEQARLTATCRAGRALQVTTEQSQVLLLSALPLYVCSD